LNENINIKRVAKVETVRSISLPRAPIRTAFARGNKYNAKFSLCSRTRRVKSKFYGGAELIAFYKAHPVTGIPAAGPIVFHPPQLLDFFTRSYNRSVGEVDVVNKPQVVATWSYAGYSSGWVG